MKWTKLWKLENSTPKKVIYTKEECYEVSKLYKSRHAWEKSSIKKHVSMYRYSIRMKWIDNFMENKLIKRTFSYEECKEVSKLYKSRSDWVFSKNINHVRMYRYAAEQKWLDDFIPSRLDFKIYTYQECLEEARKYKTALEWEEKDSISYHYAEKKKWLIRISVELQRKRCIIVSDEPTFTNIIFVTCSPKNII